MHPRRDGVRTAGHNRQAHHPGSHRAHRSNPVIPDSSPATRRNRPRTRRDRPPILHNSRPTRPSSPGPGQSGFGQQPYGGGYSTPPGFGQPPKKSKAPLWIGLGLLALVLALAGGAAALVSAGDDDPASDPVVVAPTPTPAPTPLPATTPPVATPPVADPPPMPSVTPVPEATSDAQPGATAAPGVEQSVFALQVGTCFNNPSTADEIENVSEVPCETAHDNEVFALVDFPGEEGEPFPGREPISQFAEEQCRGALYSDYVGSGYNESRYFVSQLTPTQGSWDQGDREVVCIVFGNDEQLTGSVRGAGD